MDFYAQAATTVLNLIARFGTVASIRRMSRDFNPVEGQTTEYAKESGELRALILPIATTPKAIMLEGDNKLVEGLISGKLRYIFAAAKGANFEPAALDIVVLGGETFTVLGCTPLAPAGVPLLFRIVVMLTPAAPLDPNALDVNAIESAAGDLDELVDQNLPAGQ